VVGANYSALSGTVTDNGDMSVADRSSLVARRTAAGLAAASAVLHGVMLGHAGSIAATVLIAGMAAACLYCAYELWRSGTLRAWCLVAVMNLGMVAIHLPMSGAHHMMHPGTITATPESAVMTLATVLSIVEVLIAAAVLWYRTRGNAKALGLGQASGKPMRR
jgi:hypothetical protein